ncbi:hypothetical protein [Geoglobus ahangari]|nr:hypothetical protein [Geoglobus ahangari]
MRDWNERKRDIDELYEELLSIAEVINKERKERERLKLNEKEYRVFKLLKSHLTDKTDDTELVNAVKEIMERVDSITFHRWFEKSEVVQEVERSILLYLIEKMSGKFDDITTTKNEIVRFLVNQAEKEAKTKNWKN